MKKETKAKIFKGLLVGAIVLGIAAFIVNIVLAARSDNNNEANIYTAISGWVSGVATIILGVIAVIQNKLYKQENDRYLDEQIKLNNNSIQEQKDLAWRKAKYEVLSIVLTDLENRLQRFEQYCDIKAITTPIGLGLLEKETIVKNLDYAIRKFQDVCFEFLIYLKYTPQYFEWHNDIYESLNSFTRDSLVFFEAMNSSVVNAEDVKNLNQPTNFYYGGLGIIKGDNAIDSVIKNIDEINRINKKFEDIKSSGAVYKLVVESCISDIYEKDINVLKNYYKNLEIKKQQWQKFIKEEEAKING